MFGMMYVRMMSYNNHKPFFISFDYDCFMSSPTDLVEDIYVLWHYQETTEPIFYVDNQCVASDFMAS